MALAGEYPMTWRREPWNLPHPPYWQGRVAIQLLDWNFSPTQQRICWKLLDGLSNKEIAADLGYSEKWVRLNLSEMYERAGARDRVSLILLLLRVG